jgi:16S rRNA (guanine1207-N2)-methyltransferase
MIGDPALKLLAGAPVGEGERALLLGCAGDAGPSGSLLRGYAARYGEIICHEDLRPAYAAAQRAAEDAGPRARAITAITGDLPCCETRPAGVAEDFLPQHRFPEGHFDRIVLRLGRGTALVNAALLESFRMLKEGGELIACAANQEGVKSFAKRGEAHFGNLDLLALKHSCRLLRFTKRSPQPAAPAEDPGYYVSLKHSLAHPGGSIDYRTKPGVFAYRGTDAGTALLAAQLPECAGRRVLDLGCGSGALALAAYARGASEVTALDASAVAIACAARNFAEARRDGATLCADLADPGLPGGFDLVIANPPFHAEGATDYGLPARVVAAIAGALRPGGEAWIVANQFLDYAGPARARSSTATVAARGAGYLIHHMVMPA